MRIGLVVPGGVDRGGQHRVIPAVLWLIERLARSHDVQVIVPRQENEPGVWDLLGARVHNIGVGSNRWRLGAVGTLLRLHRQKPFDVFHALWARGPGEVALAAAELCRRPLLVHVNGGELVGLPDVDFGTRRAWVRSLARFVLRRADVVTVPSDAMRELVLGAGVSAKRVPMGVDTTCWTPEPPRPRDRNRPARLVHVGSLTPVKDHNTLLRAVALLAEEGVAIHADLIGLDALEGAVERTVQELGLETHVTVHGFLPQNEAMPVVRAADLMVVASLHEAGPVVIFEAAAVGVPTVGTPVGFVRDWAPERAVSVPVADPRALADAIGDLLEDEPRRLAIAERAQAAALREDADWTCGRFEELYARVVHDVRYVATGAPVLFGAVRSKSGLRLTEQDAAAFRHGVEHAGADGVVTVASVSGGTDPGGVIEALTDLGVTLEMHDASLHAFGAAVGAAARGGVVVLVIRAGHSTRSHTARAARLIEEAGGRVAGTIVVADSSPRLEALWA